MKKRPLFVFSTDLDTGLNTIPNNTLVMVENYASTGVRILTKLNNTGLTSATTVAQALASGNIKDLASNIDLTSIPAVTLPPTTGIGAVSATEMQYLGGVTSSVQAQLNAKLSAVPASTASIYGGIKTSLSGTTLTITA